MATTAVQSDRPARRQTTSLLYAVKRLELVVRARLDEIVKPAGITALQFTALTVLERHDGLSAAQLARDSFVTAQSMADMVRALESRELVYRERNPSNRRELLIHLTEKGSELLVEHGAAADQLESRMVVNMPDDRVEEFRHSLNSAWRALCE